MIAVTKLFISLIKNDCLSSLSHVPVFASMVYERLFSSKMSSLLSIVKQKIPEPFDGTPACFRNQASILALIILNFFQRNNFV